MSICETRTRSASQRHHGAWRRSWLGIAVLLVLASLTLPRGRALPVVLLQASEAPVQSASRLSLETVQAVVDAVAQKASVLAEQVYTIVAYDETGSAPSYAWTTKASLANLTATVRNPKRHLARRDIVTDPGAFGVGTNTTLRFAVGSSFIVDMQCAPSPTRNDASIMTAFCSEAYGSVHRAISRIAQTVDLTHPVWISMNVYSFCQQRLDMADPNASVAAVCDDVDSVLGSAGPTAWYAFSPQSAAALGVWSNVTYPSSLVRQHIPDDAVFGDSSFTSNNVVYDIVANFNADFAWWFPKNDDTDAGYADFINGFMGKLGRSSVPLYTSGDQPVSSASVTSYYDMEQTLVHEFIHGLGFTSSWYPYLTLSGSIRSAAIKALMFPSDFLRNEGGCIVGMGLPYVTDRGWALAESGIWLNGYAERIRAGIDETVVALKASTGTSQLEDAAWTDDVFVSQFATTDGYQAALNLATRIKTQAIVSWYPTAPSLFVTPNDMPTTSMSAAEQVDFETSWAAAVMYTPQKLQPGSSFSHFDNQYYEGSSEFMMRPYGTQGVGLDGFMSADTRYGPIGRATLGVLTMMGYATALGPVVASLA